ncbi:MAG: C4-dicarboxylate ABC transporter permease [candidate division Zixibacteria bacterium RBG_16_53_22]|nr:MAG: C4-dicarboxylate ABC transporter permease [candidate division Zixibacteria bacterium RBG_16_53_22]
MSPPVIGAIGVVILLLFFVLEMPIAISMAVVGFIGFSLLTSFNAGLSVLARDVYTQFSAYTLTAITTFITMGCYAYATGITGRLYDASYKWVGQYRGGLAMASVFACSGFAAISGSTVATAATIGKVAIPEMKSRGYDNELAAGCIAAGGTLGILIPPSNMMIVYGIITQQSIGKLFIAGFLPGVLLTGLFALVVYITCRLRPQAGPSGPSTSWGVKFKSLLGLVEVVVLFGLVIGGLFAGFFTPTQAGGIGAAGSLLIGLARRELTWNKFINATKEGLVTSCMILFIIAGATIFGHFVAVTTIPMAFANWISEIGWSPLATMIMIAVIYLVGGCFIDMLPLVLLTLPIFYPVVLSIGYDPIWFAVIIVFVTGAGVITPPVGVNAYVVHGLMREISLRQVFSGVYPFLAAMVVAIIIMFLVPQLATYLPSFTTY